jgi:hypothetical protein
MEVGRNDPPKTEARTPLAGASGFLLSKRADKPLSPSAAAASDQRAQALPAHGMVAASVARALNGLGIALGAEKQALVIQRVLASLAFASGFIPLVPPASSPQERALRLYQGAKLSPLAEKKQMLARLRALATLESLHIDQGVDLDPRSLARMESESSNGFGDGSGRGGPDGRGGPGSGASWGRGQALGGEAEGDEAGDDSGDGEALRDLVRGFFLARGDSPNDWQAFNDAGRGRDPAWILVPFAFCAHDIDFSGFFHVLCSKGTGKALRLGAEFTANGSRYSFTVRGKDVAVETDGAPGAQGQRAGRDLARSLAEIGFGLSFRGSGGNGEARGDGGELWA